MEGSALCLVICSTLAALVSVIPVLCSRIFVFLTRSGDFWDPLDSSQGPTLVLPFASPSPFSLGSRALEGHLCFTPPGQCFSKCWSKPSDVWRPLGNQGLCQPDVWLIWCALRTRYVQLLSGFVGTAGGFAGLVLPLSKCLVNWDSESDRVFLGEGLFLR